MKTGPVKVLYWSLRQRERPVIQYPSHSKCWHFVQWWFLAYCLIPETIILLWYTLAVQWLGLLFSLPRARVQSPVGKLRSHKLCSVAKKGGKKEKKMFLLVEFLLLFWLPLYILGSHPGPSPAPEVFPRSHVRRQTVVTKLRRLAVCLAVGKGSSVTILGKCWVQPREQGGTFRGGVWQEFMWEGRGLLSCKRKWEGVGMVSGPVGVGREVSKARVERLGFSFCCFFFSIEVYSWFTMLCLFLLYNKVIQLYTHTHTHIHVYMYIHIYVYTPQRWRSGEESVYQCRRCKRLRI